MGDGSNISSEGSLEDASGSSRGGIGESHFQSVDGGLNNNAGEYRTGGDVSERRGSFADAHADLGSGDDGDRLSLRGDIIQLFITPFSWYPVCMFNAVTLCRWVEL